MLKRLLKKSWLIIVEAIALISGLLMIVLNWTLICAFSSNLSHNIRQLMIKPICTAITLFALIGLCLLLLTLYFLCIHKKRQTSTTLQITNKETREAANKFRKIFINLILKFKHEKIPYPKTLGNVVADSFPVTDKAFDEFLHYLNNDDKITITKAYNKFRYINLVFQPERYDGQSSMIYDSTEKKMKEDGLNTAKIKTGKDLLFHNLQTIIDLTK